LRSAREKGNTITRRIFGRSPHVDLSLAAQGARGGAAGWLRGAALGTNFKMNSDGQLRHFNCTIPEERQTRRREEGGERAAKRASGRDGGGDAETARTGRKTGQRIRRARGRVGGSRGMDGHKK